MRSAVGVPPPLTRPAESPRASTRLAGGAQPRRRLGQRRIGHQAGEAQSLEPVDELGQLGRLLRALDARPAQPCIALDEEVDLHPVPGEHRRETLRDHRRVADDSHLHARRQGGEPLRLRLADEREREQDVLDPGVGHHLGLAELLARDPDRSGLELEPGELGQLVGLDVRAQRHPVLVAVGLHAGDVPLDCVEVRDQHRSLQVGELHRSRRYLSRRRTRLAAGWPAPST